MCAKPTDLKFIERASIVSYTNFSVTLHKLSSFIIRTFSCPSVISKAFHGVGGAVFQFWTSRGAADCGFILLGMVLCSAVQCGAVQFSLFQNHRVRCSTVFLLKGSVWKVFHFSKIARYGGVRCGAVRLCIRLTVAF